MVKSLTSRIHLSRIRQLEDSGSKQGLRKILERGVGNKWTLSCPLVTRAKPVCQTCCLGKIYKCALKKKKAEGVAWLLWLALELSRPEEGRVRSC